MRDPRLAEIEFLMDVERATTLNVRSTRAEETSGATARPNHPETRRRYGLSFEQWRDMALHMLLSDFIVGGRRGGMDERINEVELAYERRHVTGELLLGREITVSLSHAGRIRLWDLRDALMRDPDLEPFGLRSRAAWERDLFLRLRWATSEAPLSIVFLDLDDFGAVNKTHGMPVGDAVLRAAFNTIKNLVGTRGFVYRCGGEEVGIQLPEVAQAAAVKLAEELRAAIAKEVHTQVEQLTAPQTASIGVMAFLDRTDNEDALSKVDSLMRAAKAAGKNRVQSE